MYKPKVGDGGRVGATGARVGIEGMMFTARPARKYPVNLFPPVLSVDLNTTVIALDLEENGLGCVELPQSLPSVVEEGEPPSCTEI